MDTAVIINSRVSDHLTGGDHARSEVYNKPRESLINPWDNASKCWMLYTLLIIQCHLWCNYSNPKETNFPIFSPHLESKHCAHFCLGEESWHVICGPEKRKREDIWKFNPSTGLICDLWLVLGVTVSSAQIFAVKTLQLIWLGATERASLKHKSLLQKDTR